MVARLFRIMPAVMVCLLLLLPGLTPAETAPQPGARDKCPVCGMFVAKFPDWTAVLTLKDGKTEFFDGVKDMLRYYHSLTRYAPKLKQEDIRGMRVKDYYTLDSVNATDAWYVIGSDVLGPMGKEAIPFAKEANARSFFADHRGARILRFSGMTPEVIKRLE